MKSPEPNVILIMADDLGYGDLACYGSQIQQTPNLDQMAKGGIKFLDYHSSGAVCSPTRAALMTGRYQQRAGIEGVVTAADHRVGGLEQDEFTIADLAREAGYRTGIMGKWHLGYDTLHFPTQNGFDEFKGFVSGNVDYQSHIDQTGHYDWWWNTDTAYEPAYLTDLITGHALQFIETHQHEKFFLYVSHGAPHYPYQGRLDAPERRVGDVFSRGGTLAEKKQAYQEMITVMDEGVGKIVSLLEVLGIAQNTFVFFCSDNGATPNVGSNAPFRGSKSTLWEGGHHVPAIAYWPGTIETGTSRQVILSMDLMPTVASIIRGEIPTDLSLDGVDFSDHLLKGQELLPRTVFWRFKQFAAAREGEWKYLVQGDQEYLFNLAEDPGESNNLADQQALRLVELKDRLKGWEEEMARYTLFSK